MKRYQIAIMAMALFGFVFSAQAKTVTEGTLDLERLATQISGDLADYTEKKDDLVKNIKSTQKGIEKLKQGFAKAKAEKDKTMIKARTLRETSMLLDFYSQFYSLNIAKVNAILPNLKKMRLAAAKGGLGKAARQLEDPEFKKSMTSLYANLSTMALTFNNPNLKKEIAGLLRENELLYRQGKKGISVFENITRNIDKVTDYLQGIYAKTVLRSRILQRKKVQTELAVELMRYVLALKPIQQTMLDINPEGVIDVPEIDFEDFVDPVLSDDQEQYGKETATYSDPDSDTALRGFQQNGPNFVQ